ncbi:TetR family transcriptional regulator [Methanobrevibacter sp. 87.7]|uniref:TetR/AcrR family transcriptional regulator n=1 Tax=Methanobrevibacter sp. 87.7 TaxID=387957 RepID=UPI000B50EC8F|nr:TetR/AcrR family transcriptional regulator [Methanobrevibacter sp. 87.7]OWT33705.1 TetR family transcriptional regulator [Methanobrevibacter sp. 87.7]
MNKKNNNKEKILNAATILFQEKGYYGTGLNEILRKSNCPKGSLYYYFPNGKEELAIESIKITKDFVEKRIRTRLGKIEDPSKSLEKLVNEMTEDFNKDADNIESFQSNKKISINLIALETSKTNENIRQACEEAYHTWEKAYYDKFLESGMEDAKAKKLSKIVETLIEGAIIMSTTNKDDRYISNIAKILPKLFEE